MKQPASIRADRAAADGDDLRRPDAPHLERPARRASPASSASRPATRPAPAGRRSRRRRRNGVTVYATLLGSPTRDGRNDDLAELLAWGISRYRSSHAGLAGAGLRHARRVAVRARAGRARRRRAAEARRPRRPPARRAGRRRRSPLACRSREGSRSARCASYAARQARRQPSPLVASRSDRPRPASRPRRVVREADRCTTCGGWCLMIVTVTAQRGDRPDADRPELPARPAAPRERRPHARRRQGDQRRPRAEAARRPGRRDRPRRRPDGHAHRRGADRARRSSTTSSASSDESRTSTAVVDPTGGTYTEINEWGPHVEPEELEMLLEKLALPLAAAPTSSSSPARCRAASTTTSTPRRSASSTAAASLTVLDSEGEPLRLGRRGRAVPRLAEPARGRGARRAGVLRATRTSLHGARARSPSSAPATC